MRNRKWLAVGMATALMIFTLTGCGSSGQDSASSSAETEESGAPASEDGAGQETASADEEKGNGEVVTLRMWGGVPPESGPQQACDDFNAQYADKGIQIEYERLDRKSVV